MLTSICGMEQRLFGTTANVSVRGGSDPTAFSEESGRSEIVVTSVNDSPVLSASG